MDFLSLPGELILEIAEALAMSLDLRALSRLGRACRATHVAVEPLLYETAAHCDSLVLLRAAMNLDWAEGLEAAKKYLDAGGGMTMDLRKVWLAKRDDEANILFATGEPRLRVEFSNALSHLYGRRDIADAKLAFTELVTDRLQTELWGYGADPQFFPPLEDEWSRLLPRACSAIHPGCTQQLVRLIIDAGGDQHNLWYDEDFRLPTGQPQPQNLTFDEDARIRRDAPSGRRIPLIRLMDAFSTAWRKDQLEEFRATVVDLVNLGAYVGPFVNMDSANTVPSGSSLTSLIIAFSAFVRNNSAQSMHMTQQQRVPVEDVMCELTDLLCQKGAPLETCVGLRQNLRSLFWRNAHKDFGRTPLEMARRYGWHRVADVLLQAGAEDKGAGEDAETQSLP